MLSRICLARRREGRLPARVLAVRLARLRRGEIEHFIAAMLLAHHLILFAREATAGRRNASNYSFKPSESAGAAE